MSLILLIRGAIRTKDIGAALLTLLVVGIAAWTLALPCSSFVQAAALRKFHLGNGSYLGWAIQQPIPSMYNFENRYWASATPLTRDECRSVAEMQRPDVETHFVNHYPGRLVTFVDRKRLLVDQGRRYLYLSSRYRGRELWTAWHVIPDEAGGFRLHRLESQVTLP